MINYILGGILLAAIILSIIKIRKNRKSGSCCGGCSCCSSAGQCRSYQENKTNGNDKI